MIRNYLKIAWRNLWRNRIYSLINIAGLAIGMASCLVIMVFVYHELSYDRHHDHADRIYRLAEVFREDGKIVEESASIGIPVGPVVEEAFPGVKSVRFYKTFEKIPLLSYQDQRFYEEKLLFTVLNRFSNFYFSSPGWRSKNCPRCAFFYRTDRGNGSQVFWKGKPAWQKTAIRKRPGFHGHRSDGKPASDFPYPV